MAFAELSQQQMVALLEEMTSTRNLLAYGLRVIRSAAFIDTTRDPILTMLSIGLEKLYKLTLGLVSLDHDHRWPSKTEMQRRGHNLLEMHEAILSELQTRTATGTPYIRGLVAEIERDQLVAPIVVALDLYGRGGRFYNLDELGGHSQPTSPGTAWQEIEDAVLLDPAVQALFQRAMTDTSDGAIWGEMTQVLHEQIAASVERLWIAIAVCGRNHVMGETGRVFGVEVHPDAVGRQ